jgi:hypothetical protein
MRPYIFIGGECSGRVRNEILRLCPTAYVVSADLKPAEDGAGFTWGNGGHIQDDMVASVRVFERYGIAFGAGLWHPECTYLTNSAAWAYKDGPYHQKVQPGTLVGAARRAARESSLIFVESILSLRIPAKIIENPAKGALTARIGRPRYVVHPYMFGDDASKETGLWCQGEIELQIPDRALWIPPRWVQNRPRWGNQTDTGQNRVTPGPERTAERSRTYPGIATALAVALLRAVVK